MISIPASVRDVFREWSDEFSESVWPRFQVRVFAGLAMMGSEKLPPRPRLSQTHTPTTTHAAGTRHTGVRANVEFKEFPCGQHIVRRSDHQNENDP